MPNGNSKEGQAERAASAAHVEAERNTKRKADDTAATGYTEDGEEADSAPADEDTKESEGTAVAADAAPTAQEGDGIAPADAAPDVAPDAEKGEGDAATDDDTDDAEDGQDAAAADAALDALEGNEAVSAPDAEDGEDAVSAPDAEGTAADDDNAEEGEDAAAADDDAGAAPPNGDRRVTLVRNLVKLDEVWLRAFIPDPDGNRFNLVEDEDDESNPLPTLKRRVTEDELVRLAFEFGRPVIDAAAEWLLKGYLRYIPGTPISSASLVVSSGVVKAARSLSRRTVLTDLDSLIIRLWSAWANEELGIPDESHNLEFHDKAGYVDLWIGAQRLLKIGCKACSNVQFMSNNKQDGALSNDICPKIQVQRVWTTRRIEAGDELWLSECQSYDSQCDCPIGVDDNDDEDERPSKRARRAN